MHIMCVCLRACKKETNLTKEYSAYKYILYYIYVNNCPSGRVRIQFRALYSHLYIYNIHYTHTYMYLLYKIDDVSEMNRTLERRR